MAPDLRPPLVYLVAQDPDQELGADVLEVRDLPLPLAVEAAHVAHRPLLAQGNAQRRRQLASDGRDLGAPVDMVMGVEVGRGPTDERLEGVELAGQLPADGMGVLERESLADVLAVEVPMQPDAELGMLA